MRRRPFPVEHDAYYRTYIEAVPDGDIMDILVRECSRTVDFLSGIPEEKADWSYSEGKWSVAEVIGHIVDTERVFSYRAMRMARGDKTPLASMDQDEFVNGANFNARKLDSLAREFQFMRSANIELFESFSDSDLDRRGIASGMEFTVRALVYITAGHAIHHVRVLHERYGL